MMVEFESHWHILSPALWVDRSKVTCHSSRVPVPVTVKARLHLSFDPLTNMPTLDLRIVALILTTLAVGHGTYYSLQNSTYLDTSDPFLSAHPHPLASTHALASKRSTLNVVFLKWSWAWTTSAFLPLLFTSSVKRPRRLLQWIFASGAWYILTSWFFGPSLLTRLTMASGGECGLHLGRAFVPIPHTYCSTGLPVARSTHPELFPVVFTDVLDQSPDRLIPRLRRGHDVSGHVFLLSLAVLFLADQLRQTRSSAHRYAIGMSSALVSLWIFSLWVTSVFFHAPSEKISGLGAFCFTPCSFCDLNSRFTVLGVACFALSQVPLWLSHKPTGAIR